MILKLIITIKKNGKWTFALRSMILYSTYSLGCVLSTLWEAFCTPIEYFT